jgi:hypothetical protein
MKTADLQNDLVARLVEVRRRSPDLRFGQLIATIGMLAEDETGYSLWDVEDVDFTAALNRFAADMERRHIRSAMPEAGHDRRIGTRSQGSTTNG